MKKILLLPIFFLISAKILAQREMYKLPHTIYQAVYNYKDTYYLMSNDSTYETKDGIHWKIYPNKFPCKNIPILSSFSKRFLYLCYSSGGNIYTFDGKIYTALHENGEHKSQYGGFPFVYKNQMHLFGGYGLFLEKNIISYFNLKSKTWDLLQTKTPYYERPYPRAGALVHVYKNNLYMGLGQSRYVFSETEYGPQKNNDFWTFSFETKKWTKLGESIPIINTYLHSFYYQNNIMLIFDDSRIYGLDMVGNRLIVFPEQINTELYLPYVCL